MPKSQRFNRYTLVAIQAAKAAGIILKKNFNKPLNIKYKGKINPVTRVDILSQESIFGIIKKNFPDHTIIGEEDKEKVKCSNNCWIIDPLDGTVNFIHGLYQFSVSIAYLQDGKISSAVVFAPILDEMFIAEIGKGAWLNNMPISVSKIKNLSRSLAVTGFPYYSYKDRKRFSKIFANVLSKVEGLRRLGSASLDLAYVACGRFEFFWEEGLSAWDVAAGSLIVQEAGGKVTDFNGDNNFIFGKTIIASNGKIHNKAIILIKNYQKGESL